MTIFLKRMTFSGMYSFSEREQTFEFKPGFFLLIGENGAGKSSFLNLLTLVLFDKSPSVGKSGAINERANRGKIKLEFNVDDIEYTLEYERSSKNFYWKLYKGVEQVVFGPDTAKYVEKLLGFGYDEFVSAFYLAQNSSISLKMFYGDPSDRLAILSRVFGLDRFLVASDKAKERVKVLEELVTSLDKEKTGVISERKAWMDQLLDEDYSRLPQLIEETSSKLEQVKTECSKKESMLKQETDEYSRDVTAYKERMQLAQKISLEAERKVVGLVDKVEQLRDAAAKYREYISFKPDYESVLREKDKVEKLESEELSIFNSLVNDIHQHQTKVKEIDKKMEQIMTGEGVCDRCGSKVTADQLNKFRTGFEREQEEHRAQVIKLQGTLKDVETELQGLKSKRLEMQDAIQRFHIKYGDCLSGKISSKDCDQLEFVEADLESARQELERCKEVQLNLQGEAKELDARNAQLKARQDELLVLERTRMQAQLDLESLKSKQDKEKKILETVTRLGATLEQLEAQLAELSKQLVIAKFWVGGFREIGALRLIGYVDGVNEKMGDLLKDFGMNCWIDVLEQKKSAKDLFSLESFKRKVNLFVSSGEKQGVPIEAYSGGERQLLSLALVLAFGSVIPRINYLALDETFGSLDSANRIKILELLNREKKSGLLAGACVIIATHDEDVRSEGGIWDYLITVKKESDGSILTVSHE